VASTDKAPPVLRFPIEVDVVVVELGACRIGEDGQAGGPSLVVSVTTVDLVEGPRA